MILNIAIYDLKILSTQIQPMFMFMNDYSTEIKYEYIPTVYELIVLMSNHIDQVVIHTLFLQSFRKTLHHLDLIIRATV